VVLKWEFCRCTERRMYGTEMGLLFANLVVSVIAEVDVGLWYIVFDLCISIANIEL